MKLTSDDTQLIELSLLVLLHSNNSWKDYAYKRLGSWNYDKSNRPRFHVDTLHDPGIRIEMIDLIFNLSCWYLIGSEINFWWYPIDRTQSSGSIIITHSFRVYHTHRSFKCARLQWLNRIIPTEPSTRTKFTQDCSLHVPYIGTYCLCNFIQFRRGIRLFIDWQFLLNFTSDDIRFIELSFLVLLYSNNSWFQDISCGFGGFLKRVTNDS